MHMYLHMSFKARNSSLKSNRQLWVTSNRITNNNHSWFNLSKLFKLSYLQMMLSKILAGSLYTIQPICSSFSAGCKRCRMKGNSAGSSLCLEPSARPSAACVRTSRGWPSSAPPASSTSTSAASSWPSWHSWRRASGSWRCSTTRCASHSALGRLRARKGRR